MRAEKRTLEEPLIKCKVTMGHRAKKGIARKIASPLLVISLSPARFASWLWGTNLRQRHPLFRPPYMEPGWQFLGCLRGGGEPVCPGRQGQRMSKRGSKTGMELVNCPGTFPGRNSREEHIDHGKQVLKNSILGFPAEPSKVLGCLLRGRATAGDNCQRNQSPYTSADLTDQDVLPNQNHGKAASTYCE